MRKKDYWKKIIVKDSITTKYIEYKQKKTIELEVVIPIEYPQYSLLIQPWNVEEQYH